MKAKLVKNIQRETVLPTVNLEFGKNICKESLIDTGSSINLINEKFYNVLVQNKIITKLYKPEMICKTATNSKIDLLGVGNVKVKLGRFSWYVDFVVAKNVTWDVILGTQFVNQSKMIINLHENVIFFNFAPNVKIQLCNVMQKSVHVISSDLHIGCPEAIQDVNRIVNNYPNVFTNKTGKALNFEFDIKLNDTTPVNLRPYPLNPHKMSIMREMIDKLLQEDVIEPSLSPYASPCFLVPKPNTNNKFRLVINYMELNKKIQRVNYPLGDMQELYHHLQGSKYFSVIDLCNSFHQIKLSEQSRDITSFVTPDSQFRFKRIPNGLHVGSSILSAYLNKVLDGLKYKTVINFVDDLIIYSKDYDSHIRDLTEVVQRLSDHNLTVNPEKAKFVCKEISFLGHLISENSIKIDPDRVQAIVNFKPPQNSKSVSRFIGMVSFWNKFIPNYASIAAPLNELRKKNKKFVWTNECDDSFNKLKLAITSPPVLAIPDYNLSFELHTDASEFAAGACLLQKQDGVLKPIAYYSRKFTESERGLAIYDKEALSMVNAITKFKNFLEIRPYVLVTDNSALSYVLNFYKRLGKIGRWVSTILSMPFTIKLVKSADNKVADFLSRIFEKENIEINTNENVNIVSKMPGKVIKQSRPKQYCHITRDAVPMCSKENDVPGNQKLVKNIEKLCNNLNNFPMSFKDMKTHQKEDPEIVEIVNSVYNKTSSDKFIINQGVLLYKASENKSPRIYLPKGLIEMVFTYMHTSTMGSHLGTYKTVSKINEVFYRPGLLQLITKMVKECKTCKECKPAQKMFQGKHISSYSSKPMDKCYIDAYGPLLRNKYGNKYILICVDDFTKHVWLLPVRDLVSKTIIRALDTVIFKNFSLSKVIVSDNATSFTSVEFKNYLFSKGIEHKTTIPYMPRQNKSERYLKMLKAIFQSYLGNNQTGWENELSNIQLALNLSKSEVTKTTPFNLMFNYSANHPLSNAWKINDLLDDKKNVQEVVNKFKEALDNTKKAMLKTKARAKYDEIQARNPYKVGDLVYVKNFVLSNLSKKVQSKHVNRYEGPYKILLFISDNSVVVQKCDNPNVVKKAHISQLKM